MDELYKEHILEHYRNPQNKGALLSFDIKQDGSNPSCGDSLVLYVLFDDDGRVKDASFEGDGCAISQAGASILTEKIKGMTDGELRKITPKDVYAWIGISSINPAREPCALLAYNTLEKSMEEYKNNTLKKI